MYKVQSVIIKKEHSDLSKSANWVINSGFKLGKIDSTPHTFRFRQLEPAKLRKEGYNHYITKKMINNDVNMLSSNNISNIC